MKKGKVFCNSPSPTRYERVSGDGSSHGRTRKGYVPVVVGSGDGVAGERFLIPAEFIGHPSIIALLDMSRDEFGYGYEGVIRIPCDVDSFRQIIKSLPFKIR